MQKAFCHIKNIAGRWLVGWWALGGYDVIMTLRPGWGERKEGAEKWKRVLQWIDLHCALHLHKCSLCLIEKPVYQALAEFTRRIFVVHLEDLFEGCFFDMVTQWGQVRGFVVGGWLWRRLRLLRPYMWALVSGNARSQKGKICEMGGGRGMRPLGLDLTYHMCRCWRRHVWGWEGV